jgi:hypothetical protein
MVAVKTKITSKTTSSDGRIKVASNDSLSLAKALKTSQQLFRASWVDTKYSSVLRSLANRLNSQIELAIVAELGGGQIKAGEGFFKY